MRLPRLDHPERGEDDEKPERGDEEVRRRVIHHPAAVPLLRQARLLEERDADAEEEEVRGARVEEPLDEPEPLRAEKALEEHHAHRLRRLAEEHQRDADRAERGLVVARDEHPERQEAHADELGAVMTSSLNMTSRHMTTIGERDFIIWMNETDMKR